MYKRFITSVVLAFFILNVANSQTHNSKNIYQQVQEMQDKFANTSTSFFTPNRTAQIPSNASQYVHKADYLQLDDAAVASIKKDKPETLFLDIPFEGIIYTVQLYRKDVTAPSYTVKTSSGASTKKTSSVFYRGIIQDEINSIVSLSVLSNSVRMMLATEDGNFEINKIDKNLYAAYRVSDSKHTQDTSCGTDDLSLPQQVVQIEENSERSFGDCIEVYIECDFDSYLKNGSSVSNTEDWALAIMNEVEILYDNEGVPCSPHDLLEVVLHG